MTSKFEMEGIQECVVICWQYKCKLHNTSTSWVPGEILFHEPVQHKEKNNSLMILFAVLLPGLMDNCFVKVLWIFNWLHTTDIHS